MNRESLTIAVREHRLTGALSWKNPEARRAVLLLHPHPLYGGNMDDHVLLALENVFLSMGYLTLRFNFRGAHGDRASFNGMYGAVEDAEAAYSLMASDCHLAVVGVAGYSFGGSVALALGRMHEIDFLVSLSASFHLLKEYDFSRDSSRPAHSLLFHGSLDKVVPYLDMQEIVTMLAGSRTVAVTLDGEGHFYSKSLEIVCDSLRSFIREAEAQTIGGKQT